ncbi:MAG: zinc finger domain-containing protein [Pseudomonadota bacterium]
MSDSAKNEVKFPSHKKYVEKITCVFCNGKGKDPFRIMSPLATCSVCHGLKEHYILKPFSACAYCKGTGVEPGTRNTCLSCHGRGYVSHHKGKMKVCDVCRGSGMNHETGLACTTCHGSGII